MSIRVFLVDDDELVRSTFRLYFQTTDDISVVGEATNGADCLAPVSYTHLRAHET